MHDMHKKGADPENFHRGVQPQTRLDMSIAKSYFRENGGEIWNPTAPPLGLCMHNMVESVMLLCSENQNFTSIYSQNK